MKHNVRRYVYIILYFSGIIYLLFFAPFREDTNTSVNLIPFKSSFELTAYTFTTGHGLWHWIINVPGNIAAFIPLGIILSAFQFKKWILFLLIFMVPCLIEYVQYVFEKGSCDVDDAMLNSVGIFSGFLLHGKLFRQRAV